MLKTISQSASMFELFRGGDGMSTRSHKGFFISVLFVHSDHPPQTLSPVAKVSVEEGGKSLTSFYCPSAFATEAEAVEYCFRLAEKWIDRYIAATLGKKPRVIWSSLIFNTNSNLNTPQKPVADIRAK